MSVRFKFKNDLDYQPIPCDGYHISVRDLKKTIIRRKKFGKVTDFDLIVSNSQTNQTYTDDDELISKNTTLVVQRAPLSDGKKKVWEEELAPADSHELSNIGTGSFSSIPSLNMSSTSGDSEEDKLSKMMSNSSEMYSEKHWTKYKGQRALPEGAKPPPHWKCSKCLGNHWVSDCPFANNDMKRTTGIPRSFLKPADTNVPGAKINPQGLIVVNEMEKLAYSEKKIEKNPWLLDDDKPVTSVKVTVPAELLCPICKELLSDAVMMPCCAGSACDDCARTGIVESEGSKCPVCGDVANPEELIPYRMYREKVDKFRGQTGYTKPTSQPQAPPISISIPPPASLTVKPTLPDIVLPDPQDNNFKFDALVGHRAAPGTRVEPPDLSFTLTQPPPINLDSPVHSSAADTPASKTPGTPGTPTADSPRYEMLGPGPRSPHTPTSTPPRSPSTPRGSRSGSRSPLPGEGRAAPLKVARTPPPLAPPPRPVIDMSVPPPMFSSAPPMTLLPPGHVLTHAPPLYPPPGPPPVLPVASAPPIYPPITAAPPPVINASEDPLAAFEAAMRKLDSKKASRGRSPPRPYNDRDRYRDYHDGYDRGRDYSPRRRSPGGYYSPPRRGERSRISPPPAKGGSGMRRRFVHDIPPETEQERRDRERYERELRDRERRPRVRVAPSPPREFLERENGHKSEVGENNRTPSLSPEPGSRDKENGEADADKDRDEVQKDVEAAPKLPIIRDERDMDDDQIEASRKREEEVDRMDRHYEEDRNRKRRENDRDSREQENRSSGDRDSRQLKEPSREREDRSHRDSSRDRFERERYSRDKRSPVRDRRREDSRERRRGNSRGRYRDNSRERRREDSRERRHEYPRDRRRDDSRERRRDDSRDWKKEDSKDRRREDSRERNREGSRRRDDSRERNRGDSRRRENSYENQQEQDNKIDSRREEATENSVEEGNKKEDDNDVDHSLNEGESHKKHKKEKKSKKSKKKHKRKDSDDSEDEENEIKKKKKKVKKNKDKESMEKHSESEKEQEEAEEASVHENESIPDPPETLEQVPEPQQSIPEPTKFINSFSEAPVEQKPKLNLPTLVFNDKTVELAPKNGEPVPGVGKEVPQEDLCDDREDDLLETELSKWDKDELDDEAKMHSEASRMDKKKGPETILRKALSNMEHDSTVRDKKRRSFESDPELKTDSQSKKKKKKRASVSSEEHSSEDESEKNSKKKSKKKKKGDLDIPDIPGKTLKKLLKKNLLKKKALEKLLEDNPKKKKKKRKSKGMSEEEREQSASRESEELGEERVVRRRSISRDKGSLERDKKRRRHDSEESREVKSSREGNLQIRVDNSTTKPKKLTNTIQKNLMKLSNGKGNDAHRDSPLRKSIKDRLGPVEGKSPSRRSSREKSYQKEISRKDSLRDRLGKKDDERENNPKTETKLSGIPSDLKAWALKTSNRGDSRDRRSRSRSRGKRDKKGFSPVKSKRSPSRDRRRSRSRDRRRKISRTPERKLNIRDRSRDKRRNEESPEKRRKNHRLLSDKNRSFKSDSE